jgi:hypothetical protein
MKPKCLTNSSTPVFVISSNNIQYIYRTWLTWFHSWFLLNSSNQFSPIIRPKMSALVQQHFPRSATHWVHTEWLSGVHSIMKANQPRLVRAKGGGGGARPPPFTITYKVVVYGPAERADILPPFLLYLYMYSVVLSTTKTCIMASIPQHTISG